MHINAYSDTFTDGKNDGRCATFLPLFNFWMQGANHPEMALAVGVQRANSAIDELFGHPKPQITLCELAISDMYLSYQGSAGGRIPKTCVAVLFTSATPGTANI